MRLVGTRGGRGPRMFAVTTMRNMSTVARKIVAGSGRIATGTAGRARSVARGAIGALLVLMAEPGVTDPHYGGGFKTVPGVVYRQGLVRDEEGGGEPQYATYDPDTGELRRVLDAAALDPTIEGPRIVSGKEHEAASEAYLGFLSALTEKQRAGLKIVGREDLSGGMPYASSRSFLVRDAEKPFDATLSVDPDKEPIVFESAFDLSDLERGRARGLRSLIVDGEGRFVFGSIDNIGYRVAYVRRDGAEGTTDEPLLRYDRYRETPDELLGPVTNATVSTAFNLNGKFPTDEQGRYQASFYIPPCPGFTYHYPIPTYAEIPYRSFNPQREGASNRYLYWGLSGYTCSGPPFPPSPLSLGGQLDYLRALEEHASHVQTPRPVDFQVDVTLISGSFSLENPDGSPVVLGERTVRIAPPEPADEEERFEDHAGDYNEDGADDHVSGIGSIEEHYELDDVPGRSFGVWFSKPEGAVTRENGLLFGEDDELIEPDLIRVADPVPSFEPAGFFEQIEEQDLLDTDLYVFRQGAGQLVVERTPYVPVGEDGITLEPNALNGIDSSDGTAYFEVAIPGRDSRSSAQRVIAARGQGNRSYEDWQASQGVAEQFQGDTDSLRIGEPLTVVLINRSTGYIGTAVTSIEARAGSELGITLPDVVLRPPNLKIDVERQYVVEGGLTKDETRTYRVAAEGSALHGDEYLSVRTEWLDEDGSPLPGDLPGYTGRIAGMVDGSSFGSLVRTFGIAPGRHAEVLDLPTGNYDPTRAHVYVHVSGEDDDSLADFSSDIEAESWRYRPVRSVPVRVAVHDPGATRALAARRGETRSDKEAAVHRWVYRPEMMYSVYDLDVHRLERLTTDGRTIDLETTERPVVGSTDETFLFKQYLTGSDADPLTYLGPDPDLVYTIEQYERLAAAGAGEYALTDLGFLGGLTPGDFLTINLVNNNDAGNVLWEWAFEWLSIQPTLLDDERVTEDGTIVVTADELPMDIVAFRIGGEADSGERLLTWRVLEGTASIRGEPRQFDEGDGVWNAVLDILPRAGNEVVVEGRLDDAVESAVRMDRVLVEPGMPHRIEIETDGQAYMLGFGATEVDIRVFDRHGNPVADGTPVQLSMTGGGLLNAEQFSTVGGRATAVVTGGERPSDAVGLVARAFDAAPATTTISIAPLDMEVTGLASTHTRFEDSDIQVRVSAGGSPASGVPLDFVASHGAMQDYTAETGPDGTATVSLVHLKPDEEAQLIVGLGTELTETLEYVLSYGDQSGNGRWLETADTMVLGDRTTNGTFAHERHDGERIEYGYATESPFAVRGKANEAIEVVLGDLADPNLAPMASWPMDNLRLDPPEPVFHERVLVAGTDDTLMVGPQQKTDVNGFAMNIVLSFEPDDEEAGAGDADESTELLNMDGALRLVRAEDGRTSLFVRTNRSRYALTSVQRLEGLHRVSVWMNDGELSFQVDEDRQTIQLQGQSLAYGQVTGYVLNAPPGQNVAVSGLTFQTPTQAPVPTGRMIDATGLHTAATVGGEMVSDASMGAGTSLSLQPEGTLSAALPEALTPETGLGLRFDAKRLERGATTVDEATATSDLDAALLTLGEALTVTRTPDDGVRATINTAEGSFSVDSAANAFLPETWHTVAVRIWEDRLTLWVDGEVAVTEISGALDYGTAPVATLSMMAPGEEIRYDSLRLYDWQTEPLLAMKTPSSADGAPEAGGAEASDRYRGKLDGAGRAVVTLASQGHLNDQQAGSSLRAHRVAVVFDGGRDVVSLVSAEYYQEISALFIDFLPDPGTRDDASQRGSLPIDMMIGALDVLVPKANADWLDFDFLDFVEGAWTVANFLIPLEDIHALEMQIFYFATLDERFDSDEFWLASLGTVTVFPFLKPIKVAIPGLRIALRVSKEVDGKFFAQATGPFGRAIKKVFRGDVSDILPWIPALYLIGNIARNPESIDALKVILQSVDTEEDVMTWISWLSLPTDGWEGEGLAVASLDEEGEPSSSAIDYFIGSANAQPTRAIRYVAASAARIVAVINRVAVTGRRLTSEERQQLMHGLNSLVKALRSVGARDLRSLAHTPNLVQAAQVMGTYVLANMARYSARMRISGPMLALTFAYLHDRAGCTIGVADGVVPCVPHHKDVRERLPKAYASVFAAIASGYANLTGKNGGVFELVMIAYKHFLFEAGISEWKPRVIGVDAKRDVVYRNVGSEEISISREPDIILLRPQDSDQEIDSNENQLWVEVKSYLKKGVGRRSAWNVSKIGSSGSPSREFALDCAARVHHRKLVGSTVPQMEWYMQEFAAGRGARAQEGPDAAAVRIFGDSLRQFPKNTSPSDIFLPKGVLKSSTMCPDARGPELFHLIENFFKDAARSPVLQGLTPAQLSYVRNLSP